jgi:hypothetical protein
MPQIVSTPTSSSGYCDCGPEDACEKIDSNIKRALGALLFMYKYIVVVMIFTL